MDAKSILDTTLHLYTDLWKSTRCWRDLRWYDLESSCLAADISARPSGSSKSINADSDIFEDAQNTIDNSVAAANIQPEIAAGVTYTIQAFHGILQTAARQGRFEEVAAMKAKYWRRILQGRRTRYYLLFSPFAKVDGMYTCKNAQCSRELDRTHRDAVFFRLSLGTSLVYKSPCLVIASITLYSLGGERI